jgi:hypothetical protein
MKRPRSFLQNVRSLNPQLAEPAVPAIAEPGNAPAAPPAAAPAAEPLIPS